MAGPRQVQNPLGLDQPAFHGMLHFEWTAGAIEFRKKRWPDLAGTFEVGIRIGRPVLADACDRQQVDIGRTGLSSI